MLRSTFIVRAIFGIGLTWVSNAVAVTNTLNADQFELVFAPQGPGTTGLPLTVSLGNSGATAISGFSFSISGPNAGDFSLLKNCTTLAPGKLCLVSVFFAPGASGVRAATLSINSTGTPSTLTVALQGIGTSPASNVLQAFPAVLTPSQPVGVLAEVTLSINYTPPQGVTNALGVTSVQIQGGASSDYQVASAPSTCAAGSTSCFVNIYFTPSALGVRSATLAIATSAGNLSVPLSGVGDDSTITVSLSAGSLSFNSQAINVASSPLPVTLEATGVNPVIISGVTLNGANAGDFALSDGCSGATINPTSSLPPACTIGVVFTPQAPGTRNATLTINDNAVGGPHSLMLSGVGVATGASLLVGNVTATGANQYGTTNGILPATDFGAVLVAQTGLNTNRIVNTGSTTVTLAESISGGNASAFVLNPNNDPTDCLASPTLAPNAVCTSTIGFTPQSGGINSAVLTVTDSVSGISQTFTLGGIGLAGTQLIAFQTSSGLPTLSQSMGTATVGASVQGTVQIANTGTAPVTLTGFAFAGGNASDFTLLGYYCSSGTNVLQPGDTCLGTVKFKPSGQGYRMTMLNAQDNAQNGMQSLFLTGAGAPSLATPYSPPPVNSAALDFGVTPLATTAYSSNIRFTNTGNGLVTISQLQVAGPNASDFAVYQNGCQSTLGPKQYCDVYVQYTPTATGAETAYLALVNNSSWGNVVVALYGVGETPTNTGAYITPTAVNFGVPGAYQTSTASIQLSNPGGAPLSISSASISGPDASDFTAGTPACLTDKTTCTVPLNFLSSLTGAEAATLTIVTSAGTATIPLLGSGAAPTPGLRYQTPISISSTVGTTAVYNEIIYQIGTQPLLYNIATPAVTGPNASDFAVGTLSCDTTNFTCSLPILFTPGSTGARTATLNLTTSSSSIAVQLNGLGQ